MEAPGIDIVLKNAENEATRLAGLLENSKLDVKLAEWELKYDEAQLIKD